MFASIPRLLDFVVVAFDCRGELYSLAGKNTWAALEHISPLSIWECIPFIEIEFK